MYASSNTDETDPNPPTLKDRSYMLPAGLTPSNPPRWHNMLFGLEVGDVGSGPKADMFALGSKLRQQPSIPIHVAPA